MNIFKNPYSFAQFRQDITAALTVTVIGLPMAMAYAIMAGVEPIYGLYASIIPVVVGSLLGSSRFLIGGPTNTVSMLLYVSLAQIHVNGIVLLTLPMEQRIDYLFAIAFISGVIQLFFGIVKLGKFASFLSYPVVVAYTVGCALLIAIGQLETFLGLDFELAVGTFDILYNIFLHFDKIHLFSVCIGIGTILLSFTFSRINKNLPAHFLAIMCVSLLAYFFDFRSKNVLMADFVNSYFPPFSNPFPLLFSHANELFMPALAVAIISSVDSIANGRIFANRKNDPFDVNQELWAQGLAKIAGAFTSSFAGSGSFSRTALNYAAGAQTHFAGVFSALMLLVVIGLFGNAIGYIPIPSLAAMLILTSITMIKKKDILFVLKTSKQDKLVFYVTLLSVIFLALDTALIVGVILSLGLFLNNESQLSIGRIRRGRLHSFSSEWVFENKDVALYDLEGAFFFGASDNFENTFIKNLPNDPRLFILHMSHMHFLDCSGAKVIELFMQKLQERDAYLILSGMNKEVHDVIINSGIASGERGCYLAGNLEGAIELAEFILINLENSSPIEED